MLKESKQHLQAYRKQFLQRPESQTPEGQQKRDEQTQQAARDGATDVLLVSRPVIALLQRGNGASAWAVATYCHRVNLSDCHLNEQNADDDRLVVGPPTYVALSRLSDPMCAAYDLEKAKHDPKINLPYVTLLDDTHHTDMLDLRDRAIYDENADEQDTALEKYFQQTVDALRANDEDTAREVYKEYIRLLYVEIVKQKPALMLYYLRMDGLLTDGNRKKIEDGVQNLLAKAESRANEPQAEQGGSDKNAPNGNAPKSDAAADRAADTPSTQEKDVKPSTASTPKPTLTEENKAKLEDIPKTASPGEKKKKPGLAKVNRPGSRQDINALVAMMVSDHNGTSNGETSAHTSSNSRPSQDSMPSQNGNRQNRNDRNQNTIDNTQSRNSNTQNQNNTQPKQNGGNPNAHQQSGNAQPQNGNNQNQGKKADGKIKKEEVKPSVQAKAMATSKTMGLEENARRKAKERQKEKEKKEASKRKQKELEEKRKAKAQRDREQKVQGNQTSSEAAKQKTDQGSDTPKQSAPDKRQEQAQQPKSQNENQQGGNKQKKQNAERGKGGKDQNANTPKASTENKTVNAAPQEPDRDSDMSGTMLMEKGNKEEAKKRGEEHARMIDESKQSDRTFMPSDIDYRPEVDLSYLPDRYFNIIARISQRIEFLPCTERQLRFKYPICCQTNELIELGDPWLVMQTIVLNTNVQKGRYRIGMNRSLYSRCSANAGCAFSVCPYMLAAYYKYLKEYHPDRLKAQRERYEKHKLEYDIDQVSYTVNVPAGSISTRDLVLSRRYIDAGLFAVMKAPGGGSTYNVTIIDRNHGQLVQLPKSGEPEIQSVRQYIVQKKNLETGFAKTGTIRDVSAKPLPVEVTHLVVTDYLMKSGKFKQAIADAREFENKVISSGVVTLSVDSGNKLLQRIKKSKS